MVVGTKCPQIDGLDFIKGSAAQVPPPGSPAVIEMWASWCGPCRQVFPHLTDIARKNKAKSLTVIGVTSEPKAQVAAFVEKMGYGMDYVVASDAAGACQRQLAGPAGVQGIPHAFVVGSDGLIKFSGHPLDPGFDQAVQQAVAQATPKVEKVALPPITASEEELRAMPIRELKAILKDRGLSLAGLAEKADIVRKILEDCTGAVTYYAEVPAGSRPVPTQPQPEQQPTAPSQPKNVVCEDGVCRVVRDGEAAQPEAAAEEGGSDGPPPPPSHEASASASEPSSIPPGTDVASMKISELKTALKDRGVSTAGLAEKGDLVQALQAVLL